MQVVAGRDRRGFGDRRDLRVHHIEIGAFAELDVHEGHADVETVVAGEGIHGLEGFGIAAEPRAGIDDGRDPDAVHAVHRLHQRTDFLVKAELGNHGFQGDEGERIALDDAGVAALRILFQLRARQVGEFVGAGAECIERLLVEESTVVGVLHDQGAVGDGLAQLVHGGEALFLELVGGPAADHFDPVAFRGALGLLAQHLQGPTQGGHAVPAQGVVVAAFVEHVGVGVDDAGDQATTAGIDDFGVGGFQAKYVGIGADRVDAAVLDGQGGCGGLSGVAGVDLGVVDDQVGAWGSLCGLCVGTRQAVRDHESNQ